MSDEQHMRRALELAQYQYGRTFPNPSVGCVILDREGRVISEGATGDGGRPHAEEIALRRLPDALARGGTAFVTLEPCRERTSGSASCSERLIEAGLVRVVVACLDEHPQGAGGLKRLEQAGIKVETGLLGDDCRPLYEDFFSSLQT